jgi:hypothetical protein
VHAQPSVQARTLQADENAVCHRRPLRILLGTVHTSLVGSLRLYCTELRPRDRRRHQSKDSQKLVRYTKETSTTTKTTTAAASSKQASSLPEAGASPLKMVTVGRGNRSRDQFVARGKLITQQ